MRLFVLICAAALLSCSTDIQTVCYGQQTAVMSCRPGRQCQWEISYDGKTWDEISGATRSKYESEILTRTTYFRIKFTAPDGVEYSDVKQFNITQ